mmetsp:Transcript_24528/g.62690  ORF Transcript_24528/g.62690 Transcript_24528/m.62690 type:complete len:254 (+) Transcript_24528:127-888(+)|eukprot:CAMPEP_0183388880 /NCGR_PEP_ID=MMETSP0370-20130417/4489_1 /TAXON_ID=268820 /ORGANISM="Peridinium aciculiferum, Strain PAER-2" /LENGTH=253 /DNA_ID=CAMNT_0025567981 /DNA_START=56 /DNA_END=817 /DNA_ORIENTATION=-
MALTVIVKNTFLDVDDNDQHLEANSRKRSSSVPRTCKLRSNSWGSLDVTSGPPSVASTTASDGELSDVESGVGSQLFGSPVRGGAFNLSSPAGVQKGLYMQWEGIITELVLPPAAQTEQTTPEVTTKWNLAAAEFKMPSSMFDMAPLMSPTFSPPMMMQVMPSPMAGFTPTNGYGLLAPTPLLSPGGSKLNPKAHAFEPGAAGFSTPLEKSDQVPTEDQDNTKTNSVNGGEIVPGSISSSQQSDPLAGTCSSY